MFITGWLFSSMMIGPAAFVSSTVSVWMVLVAEAIISLITALRQMNGRSSRTMWPPRPTFTRRILRTTGGFLGKSLSAWASVFHDSCCSSRWPIKTGSTRGVWHLHRWSHRSIHLSAMFHISGWQVYRWRLWHWCLDASVVGFGWRSLYRIQVSKILCF